MKKKKENIFAAGGKSLLCGLWSIVCPFIALEYDEGSVKPNWITIVLAFIIFGVILAASGNFALAYVGTVVLFFIFNNLI